MGWLDDLAQRRRREKQEQQRRIEEQTVFWDQEHRRVSGMVKSLLRDVGKAYWGSVGKDWHVEYNPALHCWTVYDSSYGDKHFWKVNLNGSRGRVYFSVEGQSRIDTVDTSEAELKRALRQAMEQGPGYEPEK